MPVCSGSSAEFGGKDVDVLGALVRDGDLFDNMQSNLSFLVMVSTLLVISMTSAAV